MAAWLHVAPLPNAENESGWVIVLSRSHPFFSQVVIRDIPRSFLRVLDHLDGYWVDDRAAEHLFHVIGVTTRVEDLCSICAREMSPCDLACVMAATRGAWAEQAAAMHGQMTERERRFAHQEQTWGPWTPPGRSSSSRLPPPTSYRTSRAVQDPRQAAADVLGVRPGASEKDIQRAFKVAIMRAHPDMGGTDAQTIAVVRARKTLLGV